MCLTFSCLIPLVIVLLLLFNVHVYLFVLCSTSITTLGFLNMSYLSSALRIFRSLKQVPTNLNMKDTAVTCCLFVTPVVLSFFSCHCSLKIRFALSRRSLQSELLANKTDILLNYIGTYGDRT